jgi:MFS family permease
VSPLSGRLSDRFGTRNLSVLGLVIIAASLFGIASLRTSSSDLGIVLRLMAIGLGVGLFQSPNNSATMGSVPRTALGIAGSLLAVMRTLGQTAGIALAGAIWAALVTASAGRVFTPITAAPAEALVSGMRGAMLVAGVLAALAILPVLAIPRGAPEPGAVAPPVAE